MAPDALVPPTDVRYDHRIVEAKWSREWVTQGWFTPSLDGSKPTFSVVLPPPNVTGELHMGHTVFSTLEDVLARWKRMQGHDVLWVPGTDHAGISTHTVVERELAKEGRTRQQLGREAFVERVWAWKEKYGNVILGQLQRLGISCDWSRTRFTMDAGLSEAVVEVFIALYREGLIYRGRYIIHWCPRCRTALSDLEVKHEDVGGKLYYLRYPLHNRPDHVVVATTRPETMLGDTAVAVHPEDPRYRGIVGGTVRLPLANREIPVIADDQVDKAFGTGAVKVTPSHDPVDFELGRRHALPEVVVIGLDGTMAAAAGSYAGLSREVCRDRVIEDLTAQGLLDRVEDYTHSVGHCDRCHTVVEPMVSLQWFVKMAPLAKPAREAVERGDIRFVPSTWKATYFDWLDHIRDWCISRQLWWGHRLPVWYCAKVTCQAVHVDRQAPARCDRCGHETLVQDPDVLDTWFSSALWPFSTLGWPKKTVELAAGYPATVVVTGFDIIFFWVAKMIMMGLKFTDQVPFRTVYLTPLVRDPEGKKMSKSKGNVVSPAQAMEQYGADAIRFTMIVSSVAGRDIHVSNERYEGYRNFSNKIWNAARFVRLSMGEQPDVVRVLPAMLPNMPDRWIMSRMQRVITGVTAHLEAYRFHDAAQELYDFIWKEWCDWYLECAKLGLPSSPEATRAVLQTVLDTVLRLLHPMMPYVTEEIWATLPGTRHALASGEGWPVPDSSKIDAVAERHMEELMEVIRAVRALRADLHIQPGLKIPVFIRTGDGANAQEGGFASRMTALQSYLHTLAQVQAVTAGSDVRKPDRAVAMVLPLGELYLPLEGMVDAGKERARLQGELEEVGRRLHGVVGRLDNEAFRSRAPAEVLQEEETRRNELHTRVQRLRTLLGELAS